MVSPGSDHPPSLANKGSQVTFISWNVRGVNQPLKCNRVLSHLLNLKGSVVFLQETHLKDADQQRLKRSWVGQIFHSKFNARARGTAILINKNTPFIVSGTMADSNGRYTIVTGSPFNTPLILANIYAPNWDNPNFFIDVLNSLPQVDSHHLILGGDMNMVMDQVLDRSSTKHFSISKSAQILQTYLQTFGAVDIWRHLNPSTKQYSFFSPVNQMYSRIDYFVDKTIIHKVKACNYSSIVISDHGPLILELTFPEEPHVYAWRLNPLLLSDNTFLEYISKQIDIFLETNITPDVTYCTIWESFKAFLRGHIISYCSQDKRQRQKRLTDLRGLIAQLDNQHSRNPSPGLYKQRMVLQTEYNLISTRHAEQIILKSRRLWYEHGEKASKILAHQLRQSEAARFISEIRTQDGHITNSPQKINERFQLFYSELYRSESLDSPELFNQFFESLDAPTLDPTFKDQLEILVSIEEIKIAIDSMQGGKSPGPDGFPVEFFKIFKHRLAPLLRDMFIESLNAKQLPPTLRQATISLLLKPNKDPLDCSSYRPISLLNVDFKILSKTLAIR